jgi:hypothetical protein
MNIAKDEKVERLMIVYLLFVDLVFSCHRVVFTQCFRNGSGIHFAVAISLVRQPAGKKSFRQGLRQTK